MINFFNIIFGDIIIIINSYIIKILLKLKGIKVGKNFYISGVPKLKLNSTASNISIGNNVKILGDIDLRIRENGKISFHDNVTIEENCRFVSARDGLISIGENTKILSYTTINGGSDVLIGKNCLIGKNTSINSNSHLISKKMEIVNQGYNIAPVVIEDDCWTGINSVITMGVIIKKGSIVGANSLVNKSTDEYSINVGLPSTKKKFRE